ncbi:DUF5723 family protein [Bacteroidota bacterium]
MNLRFVKYGIIICSFIASNVFAQYGSIGSVDARSMGMGKTYTASTFGVYSIGLNPANMILEDSIFIQFATVFPLPTVSARGGIDALSLDDVNYFFSGVDGESRVLSESDKQRLNGLFSDGGYVSANTGVQLLSFQIIPDKNIGAFAFAVSDFSGGVSKIPGAIVDLALNGNPVDKVFDFSDVEFQAWWIRNYSLSYARKFNDFGTGILKSIATGISIKLVHGFAYAGKRDVNSFLRTSNRNEISAEANYLAFTSFSDNFGVKYEFDSLDHHSGFQLFPGPAGTGFGLDLGLSFLLDNNTIISLALTDIGSINWNRNTAKFIGEGSLFIDDLSDEAILDSLLDEFTETAEPAGEFSTGLATAFRFGAAYRLSDFDEDNFPGYLLLAADYNHGFNNLPGNSSKPRYSFGFEWQVLDFLPLIRSGVDYSEVEGINWAFGLGYTTSLVDVNIATNSFQTTFSPGSTSNLSLSLSSRWKF